MIRLAVDTNAAVDYLRPDRVPPPQLADAEQIFLPLPVLGELYAGAFSSARQDENIRAIQDLVEKSTVLVPMLDSARIYGQLRARVRGIIHTSKLNDLWIAALCLQHNLPLLTNDSGFDHIAGLSVIHW
jgi:tRNA(fMet)-specific endonuclease VapC